MFLYGTAGRNRTSISSFVARGILHYTTAVNWWRISDSNRSPTACKAAALPDELIPRFGGPKGNRTPADGVTSRYTYRYTMEPNLVECTGIEPVMPEDGGVTVRCTTIGASTPNTLFAMRFRHRQKVNENVCIKTLSGLCLFRRCQGAMRKCFNTL